MNVAITLLGGFEVVVDGRPVAAEAWSRRGAAALVKVLALQPGRRLPRERLVDLLWPDLLLDRAAPRLHKAAHQARRALGDDRGVVLSDGFVTLLPDTGVDVDVARFEAAAAEASTVSEALEAYRGDLLPDDLYEAWTGPERERLRGLHLELLRSAGHWEALVAADPLDEEARVRLVEQHVASGRRASALRQLEEVDRLWAELGAAPSAGLEDVRRRVAAMPALDPAHATAGRGAARLPRPATRTVGRDADVAAVVDLLGHHGLVTLLGLGGVGKTRLAAEVAAAVAGGGVMRACYVDLTKVSEADQVAELVVRELGIRAGDDQDAGQVLHEALHRQSMLVVLDNFEHVLEAAPLVSRVLAASDSLRVLVTSRARLRLAGEQVVEVQPLAVASDDAGLAPAVALFDQVARAIDPAFDLAEHLDDVVAVADAVDGLPLALEIAGGHLRTLSPALLRERLTDRLASRVAAGRDLPHRQQTIPTTIDWSLQLLGDRERQLFARLSVFATDVPLDAVEAIWTGEDALDPLSVLVEHSLVRRTTGPDGSVRFGMLALVRDHARSLLRDDRTEAGAAHAAYVAAHLDDLYERRWTDAAANWLDDITELLQEVRAAHAWADAHEEAPLAARIAADLGAYWFLEGHHGEGLRWVGASLEAEADLEQVVVARLHLAAGFLAFPRSQDEARTHWQTATSMFRGLGEERLLAYALAVTSVTYVGDPDPHATGLRINDEALALARRTGSPSLTAQVLNIRGEITRVAGEDALARAAYEEGLAISRELEDEMYVSVFLANLSYLADHRGDFAEARRLTHEALRLCWSLGRRLMAAWTISQLAGPEHGLGRSRLGAVLVGAGDEALRVLGAHRHPGDVPEHERVIAGIRAALGDEEFEELRAEGARLTLDEALALAIGEAPAAVEAVDEPVHEAVQIDA